LYEKFLATDFSGITIIEEGTVGAEDKTMNLTTEFLLMHPDAKVATPKSV